MSASIGEESKPGISTKRWRERDGWLDSWYPTHRDKIAMNGAPRTSTARRDSVAAELVGNSESADLDQRFIVRGPDVQA